jgi:hypothetical protein
MKIAVAILSFIGIFGLSSGQESAPTNQAIAPSVGLEVGQRLQRLLYPISLAINGPTRPSKARRVLCFFFSVPPIGDPSAKRSSCSCKTQNKDLRRRG